jgi:hypothetical protein
MPSKGRRVMLKVLNRVMPWLVIAIAFGTATLLAERVIGAAILVRDHDVGDVDSDPATA